MMPCWVGVILALVVGCALLALAICYVGGSWD